jgi:LPXTG-motif cell wall-anchored protein
MDGDLIVMRLNLMCTDYLLFFYHFSSVKASADIPTSTHIIVHAFGVHTVYDGVMDLCTSNIFTPPAGDDAGYGCPDAGIYNFAMNFVLPGYHSYYSEWTGFTVPLTVTFKDAGTTDTVAYCSMKVTVEDMDTGGSSRSAYIAGGAVFGIAGLASLLSRRRRVGTIQLDSDEATLTNFEMIVDPYTTARV